jgi:hypothetical protein
MYRYLFVPSTLSTTGMLANSVARAHGDVQSNGLVPVIGGVYDGIYRFSAHTRFKFIGRATRAWVTVFNDIGDGINPPIANNTSQAFIPYRDHGLPAGDARDMASHRVDMHWQTVEVLLPGSGYPGVTTESRLVEFVQGSMASGSLSATSPPQSVWLHSVVFDAPMTPVAPPTTGAHELDIGDSISAPGSSAINPLMGIAGRRKRTVTEDGFDGLVSVLGYGYAGYETFLSTSGLRSALIAKVQAMVPAVSRINFRIGINDQLATSATAPSITNWISLTLADMRAASGLGTVPCRFFLPLMTFGAGSRESAGVFGGSSAPQIRTAIAAGAATDPASLSTVIDWTGDFDADDMVDGLHPGTEAFAAMRALEIAL